METARAFGKLILAGEHAVVYGVPAIAVGIDRGARAAARPSSVNRLRIDAWKVDVTENGDGDLSRAFTALLASARSRGAVPLVEIDASTDLPAGGGLGCSAALGVAVARAVSPEACDEEVLEDAMAWEKIFHGNPSGVDAAVATLGGAIQFVRGAGVENVRTKGSLVFAIGHSGNASSTKTMVEGLARLREAEPAMVSAAFERIRVIASDVRAAIESGDVAALGAAMGDNQRSSPSSRSPRRTSTRCARSPATPARSGASSRARAAAAASSRSRRMTRRPSAFFARGARVTKKASSPSSVRLTHGNPGKPMARTSRLPGFYKISVDERRALVGETTGVVPAEVASALEQRRPRRGRPPTSSSRTSSARTPCRTASRSTCASTATTTSSRWSSRSRASSRPRRTPRRWSAQAAASSPRWTRRS